jgi:signal transduction histidine kinase
VNRVRRWTLPLTWRTVLLLVGAVLASLLITAVAFEYRRQADFVDFRDSRARSMAALVHTARVMLEAVPSAQRAEVSEALAQSGTLQVFRVGTVALPPASSAPPPRRNAFEFWHRGPGGNGPADLEESIARYSQPPVEVHFRGRPGPRFWVRQEIGGESWWIVVLVGEPPQEPPQPLLVALALILILLLIASGLYAATITRPIAALAAAAQRVGEEWPDPVPPRGPTELRDLAERFNAMLERLREVETERRVLIGGLPHDLRAPLARLRLRVAMLPESAELEGIHADIAAVERIVRQFTDYLRGEQPAEAGLQPLGPLVDECVAPYRSLGEDVRAEIGDGAERDVPQAAVRRILDNLVHNALQHGRAPVVVRAAVRADALELAVTDAGDGVPGELRSKALEPFTKLDVARGRGGCGLGLAIVRQLARRHRGDVRLDGAPGAFTVRATLRLSGPAS